jgi:hypothetical protein
MTDTEMQEMAVSSTWKTEYHFNSGTKNKPNNSHPNVFRKRNTPPSAKLNSVEAIKAADR